MRSSPDLNGTTSASEGMDAVSRSTNANSDEQEAEYYHNLTSPTNEEVVIVESIKPGDTDTEIQPGDSRDVQSAKASVVDAQGYIEEETDNNPSQILPGKRNREDQGTLDDAAGDGQNMDGEREWCNANLPIMKRNPADDAQRRCAKSQSMPSEREFQSEEPMHHFLGPRNILVRSGCHSFTSQLRDGLTCSPSSVKGLSFVKMPPSARKCAAEATCPPPASSNAIRHHLAPML